MIPYDVSTFTTREQGETLYELARDKTCLEVGAWLGFTTICMAKSAKIVYSIDSHKGDIHTGKADTFEDYYKNLRRYHVLDKVAILVGESTNILPRLDLEMFDLVFIDATHTYEAVKKDIELTLPLIRKGIPYMGTFDMAGLIAFHDYEDHPDFEVDRAVDEFIGQGVIKKIKSVGSLLVCQSVL